MVASTWDERSEGLGCETRLCHLSVAMDKNLIPGSLHTGV